MLFFSANEYICSSVSGYRKLAFRSLVQELSSTKIVDSEE